MRPLVRKALGGSLRDIRHVEAVRPAAARGLVARVYVQAERDFGLVAPPLALHSPAPATLAAAWALLRETLLVPGRVGRAAKETVATAVSLANQCPYCVEIHQAKLDTLPAAGGLGPLADWARTTAGPAGEESRPPFGSDDAAEILGVAVTFHYLNRMVGLFLPESPVPPSAPAAVRGTVLRTVARAMRPAVGTTPRPAWPCSSHGPPTRSP
ncbi:carboxymuconolactone decarboxylase family protein, partial [Streptomyces sp. URMC 125]|uniref:carboxymuconolactone decarboxylase family protein n=1 Tax=Streptomyces sp. URMC 125 TaxID=3423419 RepID=UPI003F1C0320